MLNELFLCNEHLHLSAKNSRDMATGQMTQIVFIKEWVALQKILFFVMISEKTPRDETL